MARKLLSIVVLIIFSGMNLFVHVLYDHEIDKCHKAYDENIFDDRREIKMISFNNEAEINWRIKGKEFECNGKLFDVAEISSGKTITIKYFEDSKEEIVEKTFVNYNKEENTKQKSQKTAVVFEYLPLKEFTIISYECIVSIHSIINSNSNTTDYFKIDSPPPEV